MAHAADAGARDSRPPDAPKRSRRAEPAEWAARAEPWHALATERVLAKLHTAPHGLTPPLKQPCVEEGRRVNDNLGKAFAFVLPTNIGLALILIVAVVFFPITDGAPLLPITALQILWINLVAAVALALPLGFKAMEPNLMGRPPRRPNARILSPFVITRTVVVAVRWSCRADDGRSHRPVPGADRDAVRSL